MARQKGRKQVKFKVAIVGEGITEWHYFNDLKQNRKYTYEIKPSIPKHSDFKSIFSKAEELAEEGYDKIYCVLDLDIIRADKSISEEYLKLKRAVEKKDQIKVFETMPCIEYWFLIHFKDFSTKIYPTYDSLKEEVKGYLPNYDKTHEYFRKVRIYTTLVTNGDLNKACDTSRKLRQEKEESDNELCPFSEIDLVIEKL